MGKRKAAAGLGGATTAVGPVLDPFSGGAYDPAAAPEAQPVAGAAPEPLTPGPAEGEEAAQAPGVQMFDAHGGAVTVDPGEAKRAFLAGDLYFSGEQKVHLKGPRDRVYEVEAKTAAEALKHGGYSLATSTDVEAAHKRAEQNTIGKTLEAGAVGAARGLTLGLGDPLAIETAGLIGGDEAKKATREHLRDLKEYHPVASVGGEIAGALAPVVLSAGTGAAAEGAATTAGRIGEGLASGVRGAGILPRAVAGAGELVEHQAAHLLGHGATSLAGQVAQKAIPLAAQGAVEGGLYGVGSEISESALGDHELNAEKLLAAAKHGAVFGALTGGVIGAGEVLGRAAVKQGMRFAGKESVEDFFHSFAQERTVKALGGDAAAMRRLGEDRSRNVADTVLDYQFKDGEKLFKPGATVDELGERVGKALDEQNGKLAAIREKVSGITAQSAELAPDVRGMLSKIDTDVLGPLKSSDVASVRSKASKIEKELETLRARVAPPRTMELTNRASNDVVEGVDLINRGANDSGAIAANENASAVRSLAGAPANENAASHSLAELNARQPVSIDELTKFRKDLDSVLYPKVRIGVPPPAPEHAAELLQVRRMVEDEIEASTERAAKASGDPALYSQFLDAKDKIHNLIPAQQMAEKAAVNQVGHRFFSLSDTLYSAGAGSGLLAGGGLASLGAIPGGLATAAAHKFIRERGSSYLAAGAERLAKFAAIQRATNAVDERIAVGVKDFLTHSGREALHVAAEAHAAEEGQEQLEKTIPAAVGFLSGKAGQSKADVLSAKREHAAELATNPGQHADRVAGMVEDVAAHAPQTAMAMTQRATATTENLKKQLPPMGPKSTSLTPQLDKPRLSATDAARFARYAAIADKPLTLLDDMKAHRLTRDSVAAMKQNSPKLLEQIQNKVRAQVLEAKAPIPYETRKQIGVLLGIPGATSQAPDFVKTISSQVYQPQHPGQGHGQSGAPPSGPKRALKLAGSHLPASAGITAGE